jgi:hypothetical protein
MKNKVYIWIAVITMFLMGTLLIGITPAFAQTPSPEKDDTCVACHENLYVLYDTGKWYCLCGETPHCSYCHGGVVGTLDEKTAHQGMIANPVGDNTAICQNCHPEDYSEHVAMFAAHGGIQATPISQPTYNPALAGVDAEPVSDLLRPHPMETWRAAGLGATALGFVLVIIFAIHCYKQDCLLKRSLK